MQRWKTILYNAAFALNCLLVFLLVFEGRLTLPAWLQTVGRMHPLLLHFPIVLVVLCAVLEAFSGIKKSDAGAQTSLSDGLLLATALTAVVSALLGLFLSREEGYEQEALAWHKWGGIGISLLTLAWYAFRQQLRRSKVLLLFSSLCGIGLVIFTGHLGGNITHGEGFLLAPLTAGEQKTAVLFDDAVVYTHLVQPILKAKCVSCHNADKSKGGLVMEPATLLLKGGKSGALWDSTQADFGLMMARLHLPLEDKKHMPPTGKPQLTEEEERIIYHWLHGGASLTAKLSGLPEKDSLRLLAAALFNTVETDTYSFEPADDDKVKALNNTYRRVAPLAMGSPALGVEFFGAAQFKAEQLQELLVVKEQIVSLTVNKMPLKDDDLRTIAQFTNLRKLNLSFTNIKGSGLSALGGLKELRQLSLSGTGVNSADLASLAGLPKLSRLYVWRTPAQVQNLSSIHKQLKGTAIETGFGGDSIVLKLNSPRIENDNPVIDKPTPLKITHSIKGVSIRYTTDGTEPDSLKSALYKEDVLIDTTTVLKAKAFKEGWLGSDVTERSFYRAGYPVDSVSLLYPPEPKYGASGAATLNDGQKGDMSFRYAKWLGYMDKPLEAFFYFNTARPVSAVSVSALVETGYSVMPPQQVEVWAGKDGTHLRLLKKIVPEQPLRGAKYMKGYDLAFNAVTETCFKVVVVPVPRLPPWLGEKRNKGWVFVDEIFLK